LNEFLRTRNKKVVHLQEFTIAKIRLNDYLKETPANLPVIGGDQILENGICESAEQLQSTVDKLGTSKLGAGAYACRMSERIVLNGFFPNQRLVLSRDGSCLVALACSSTLPWKGIRAKVIGSIFPREASRGTLRREIFENHKSLGIVRGDSSQNYIHFSPGPVEGLRHLLFYFSSPKAFYNSKAIEGFSTGQWLLNAGFDENSLNKMFQNRYYEFGSLRGNVIEITEDEDIHTLLASASKNNAIVS